MSNSQTLSTVAVVPELTEDKSEDMYGYFARNNMKFKYLKGISETRHNCVGCAGGITKRLLRLCEGCDVYFCLWCAWRLNLEIEPHYRNLLEELRSRVECKSPILFDKQNQLIIAYNSSAIHRTNNSRGNTSARSGLEYVGEESNSSMRSLTSNASFSSGETFIEEDNSRAEEQIQNVGTNPSIPTDRSGAVNFSSVFQSATSTNNNLSTPRSPSQNESISASQNEREILLEIQNAFADISQRLERLVQLNAINSSLP